MGKEISIEEFLKYVSEIVSLSKEEREGLVEEISKLDETVVGIYKEHNDETPFTVSSDDIGLSYNGDVIIEINVTYDNIVTLNECSEELL